MSFWDVLCTTGMAAVSIGNSIPARLLDVYDIYKVVLTIPNTY